MTICEWTNEWMNEWMTICEWMNEWMTIWEWMNEWLNLHGAKLPVRWCICISRAHFPALYLLLSILSLTSFFVRSLSPCLSVFFPPVCPYFVPLSVRTLSPCLYVLWSPCLSLSPCRRFFLWSLINVSAISESEVKTFFL